METQKHVVIPDDLAAALQDRPDLQAVFERMRPSCQREYADWVDDAKKIDTRQRRIASVLTQVSEWGKRHPIRVPQL
jgi:uncharacterized protein YdeI (YjbR/CyaY-like superfamily)